MQERLNTNRRSGIRSLLDEFKELGEADLTEFLQPYLDFQKEYEDFAVTQRRKRLGVAYKVTCVDDPSILYIAFTKNKDVAKGVAIKYFRGFHPDYMGRLWREKYNKFRACRIKEFDKYATEKKIPIYDLMEVLGVTFPCSYCGKFDFNYDDYKKGLCIIEEDGDLNIFTKGHVLCRGCERMIYGE